ncbi:FMN-linked oxidoreductase [Xylariaceae sp. FL0255]|nr:FMN-linked oxidoreductase [Xylariaceae sp. FL0255]
MGETTDYNLKHLPPPFHINPPLLNSANPWATTLEDLRELYMCSSTGAVTTRTALLDGFKHDGSVHRFAFFDVKDNRASESRSAGRGKGEQPKREEEGLGASLNTLGYSPIPLGGYLEFIETVDREEKERAEERKKKKGFVISVTGTPDEVAECYRRIARLRFGNGSVSMPLAMEVNLSCPNIPGKPPPAYEGEALRVYVDRIAETVRDVVREYISEGRSGEEGQEIDFRIPWGLKTPPYTHAGEFEMFVGVLRDSAGGAGGVCPASFVTATNTLGSCLLLAPSRGEENSGAGATPYSPALPGLGIGGMAGSPLHPLALGNVATLRRLLDGHESTKHVMLIGVGGVGDEEGYRRMRAVGAGAVGVGTALGRLGLSVFGWIERGLGGRWEG